MPKKNSVFGVERINLTYAIVGWVMAQGNVCEVAELAEHFDRRPDEIVGIIHELNRVETGDTYNYSGLPIFFDIDELEDGYVVLTDVPDTLDVPRLTTTQTAAITAGLMLLKETGNFEFNDDLDQLLAALHPADSTKPSDTIVVEPIAPDADLETMRAAIGEKRAIKCDYINGQGIQTTDRVLEPIRLFSMDSVWYVKAYCVSKAHEVRSFRLDAMDKVVLLDQPSEAAHLALDFDENLYTPGANAIDVIIEVEPEAYQVLRDYHASYNTKAKGTVKATIKVTSLQTLPPMVASYGGAVRVIEPAEARNLVRDYALKALGQQVTDAASAE